MDMYGISLSTTQGARRMPRGETNTVADGLENVVAAETVLSHVDGEAGTLTGPPHAGGQQPGSGARSGRVTRDLRIPAPRATPPHAVTVLRSSTGSWACTQSLKMNCLLAGGEMANLLQKLVLFLGIVQKTD